MGISSNSKQNEMYDLQNNNAQLQNQLLNMQVSNAQALNPQMLEAQKQTLTNDINALKSPVWGEGVKLAENTMPQISYQNIGFDNPNVQNIQKYLNDNSTAYAKDLISSSNNNLASKGLFGSSYDALEKSRLGDLFARMYNENAINSLSTAQSLYNNNLSNAMNIVKFGMGDSSVELPNTNASISNPYTGANSSSGGVGANFNISGSDIGNAAKTAGSWLSKLFSSSASSGGTT